MILNEDYFKDLEIENDDIIEDDILDVEKPDLTLDEFHKLPEQYDYLIKIMVEKRDNTDTTLSFQTSLLPRITKRLDAIFESYGIEHSEYILTPSYYTGDSNTILDFGNYQFFCEEENKNDYLNDIYRDFYICAYVNYPKFSYKRAFRFVYTMLNIFKFDEHFCIISFAPTE